MHATQRLLMTSFLFLSFSETPVSTAAFSFLFSPVALPLSLSLSRPLLHTSALVLYSFPLNILATHKTTARSFHYYHAALILFLISCSQPPLAELPMLPILS